MMRRLIAAIAMWCLGSSLVSAQSEQVVAGLSHDSVAITASFDGSEILIYGAVKRETPIPNDSDLNVIITIEAPSLPMTIWKKERKLGVWVNSKSLRIGDTPALYVVATTGPLDQILDPYWDQLHQISQPAALDFSDGVVAMGGSLVFPQQFQRLSQTSGLYRLEQGAVKLVDDTLFRADVNLPANLLEGQYDTRIFLLRDGAVIDEYSAPIFVRKVGIERWLYRLAFDHPLLYGLMSLAVAVAAGWGASTAFRMLRRA